MESKRKCYDLPKNIPLATISVDLSQVYKSIKNINIGNWSDLKEYIESNMNIFDELIDKIRIININDKIKSEFGISDIIKFQGLFQNNIKRNYKSDFIYILDMLYNDKKFIEYESTYNIENKNTIYYKIFWYTFDYVNDYSCTYLNLLNITPQIDIDRKLRFMLNFIPIILFEFDINHRVIDVRGELQKLLDEDKKYLIGKKVEDSPFLIMLFNKINFDKKQPQTYYVEFKNKYLNIYATDYVVGKNINNKVVLVVDTTELKQKELQLFKTKKIEALGKLAAKMNHDFNNIFMSIHGSLEIIQMLDDINEVKDYIEVISNAINKASSLTKQISAFSKIDVGVKSVFDAVKTIKEIEIIIKGLLDEQIKFISSYTDEPFYLEAENFKIEQIVLNLITNAKEAIYKDGVIKLIVDIVEITEEKTLKVGHLLPGKYLLISVADNGVGIDKDDLDKLFDLFYTTKESGTGLGLDIIYGTVTQLNGAIDISSKVGYGTTVKIYIPKMNVKPNIPIKDSHLTKLKLKNIFIIDDNIDILKTMSSYFRRRGYNVLTASNFAEVNKIWKSYSEIIDLIICDVVLPEFNGPNLIALLQMNRYIPTIYMTGYINKSLSDLGIDPNNANMLLKPFKMHDLEIMIADLLFNKNKKTD